MAEIEKIYKGSLLSLFTELQTQKTPLKMQLPNSDKTHLRYIIDIRKHGQANHFMVKLTEADLDLDEEGGRSSLQFEFVDSKDMKYAFETDSWELANNQIWVRFPEFVRRFQRRKLYRLEAPHGTRLYFKVNDIRYKLLVINVSLGGTLGVLVSLTKQMENELKGFETKMLEDVELVFPAESRKHAGSIVKIKRCQIIRQERNSVTGKFECAFEFKDMSELQQKNLTDLFYKWQRKYLRRRKVMRA